MAALRKRDRPTVRGRVLEGLVKERGWRMGAELGVLQGATFMHLLRSCPELNMVGVDIWEPRPDQEHDRPRGGRSYLDHDLNRYLRDLRDALRGQHETRAVLLQMPTAEAARHFPEWHFDFVFVDADHTYEGVMADIDAWWPKVRRGGMMLGHDWNERDFPGVVSAVRKRFGQPAVYPDKVWGVEK